MQGQSSLGMELPKPVPELGAKDPAQRVHRKEVVGGGAHPPLPIGAESASTDHQVQVVMIQQRLTPGVQHRRHPQGHAESVLSKLQHRFRGRPKEQV